MDVLLYLCPSMLAHDQQAPGDAFFFLLNPFQRFVTGILVSVADHPQTSNRVIDIDLSLNQAAKPWFHPYLDSADGTICGGLFPKM